MDNNIKEIVEAIASIQLEAIAIIEKDPTVLKENLDLCKMFHHSWLIDQVKQQAKQLREFYLEVKENPSLLLMANEYQILVCHHILFTMEDEWIINNPGGVSGAWELLHKALCKYHPEFVAYTNLAIK